MTEKNYPTSAIVQIPTFNRKLDIQMNLEVMSVNWSKIYEKVGATGSLLLIGRNEYHDDELIPWPLLVADRILQRTHFKLKNIIIYYKNTKNENNKDLVLNHIYLIFLVHSLSDYYFNKDSIREEHIFKDIEWGGKREKGNTAYHNRKVRRYSLKGRDPGNVLYKTERDEKGKITKYNEYEISEIYEKFILLLTKDNSTIITNIKIESLMQISKKLNRKLIFMEQLK